MMRLKVLISFILFGVCTMEAGDVPAVWMLSDRISVDLAVSLNHDLANTLIFDKMKVENPFSFDWKECPSGSNGIYQELKKAIKGEKTKVLFFNCGWGDVCKGGNKPDTTSYRKNLELILQEASEKKMEVVWFNTPFYGKKEVDNAIMQLNTIADNVMEKANIRTIDFYHYWERQLNDSIGFHGKFYQHSVSLQSSFLSESLSQWWTASARTNRSVKRIRLWDDLPPSYKNEGNECVNSLARIDHVSIPELELFLPQKRKAATAVLFFPGGGYKFLGFLRNARELAEILNPYGIAVIGLKYRTGRTPDVPLLDAKRAVRFVKAHAKEWGMNPSCIGVAGQSAGAHLVLNLISNLDKGYQQAEDRIEREDCIPAFAAVFSSWNFLSMNSPFVFGADTPPFFVRHAKDDSSFQLVCEIVQQLKEANVPSDVLFLETGGHGAFEISEQNTGHDWPVDFVQWLSNMNFYKK